MVKIEIIKCIDDVVTNEISENTGDVVTNENLRDFYGHILLMQIIAGNT